uniref:HAT C-terminal dimerisation domain-containing protein n=1 Tax=Latimeria chalumnae TaxID=7897 RepID=H3B7B9_LATCH
VGKNSLSVCFKGKNESTYINSCSCHVLHNAAQHASKAFVEASEDFLVDLYYYFQGSTLRQVGAAEFAGFCDQEYQRVLKYASTRWLSMELAVARTLKQYRSLKSYFDSQADKKSDLRLTRLKYFHNPMTEVCLFFQSVLPIVSNANLVLQKESPQLHHMVGILECFVQLLGRFMCPDGFANVPLTEIDPMHYHLSDNKIMIGFSTRRLIQSSNILPVEEKTVISAAKEFMVAAFRYSRGHLPLTDAVANHANFETFHDRVGEHMDSLYDEFVHYQQLSDAALPSMPVQIKVADGTLCFLHFFEVANFVLVLPHSSASEECVFSIIQKNCTDFRPNLIGQALPSILTCSISHLYHIPCQKFKPSNDLLCKVKAA